MCFLITADGFRPFLLHLSTRVGVKQSLMADQGTVSHPALLCVYKDLEEGSQIAMIHVFYHESRLRLLYVI